MSTRWLLPLLCVSLLSACAATGDVAEGQGKAEGKAEGQGKAEGDAVEPPAPKLEVKLAIASVQLIQDCPDPPEPSPAADTPAPGDAAPAQAQAVPMGAPSRRSAEDSGPGFVQPCDQSTMQLTVQVDGEAAQTVKIAAIRLLDKQDKAVGQLRARKPSVWKDQAYVPWDERVTPGAELKASYKLSLPDWSAVERAIGESSFGYMFRLEVDVEIDGQVRTLQSPTTPREEPNVIVT